MASFLAKKLGKLFRRSADDKKGEKAKVALQESGNVKLTKKQKKQELKDRKRKDAQSTSFPSSAHSAEIRIRKIAQPNQASQSQPFGETNRTVKAKGGGEVSTYGSNRSPLAVTNAPNVLSPVGKHNNGANVLSPFSPSNQSNGQKPQPQRQFLVKSQKSTAHHERKKGDGGGDSSGFDSSDDDDSENRLNYPTRVGGSNGNSIVVHHSHLGGPAQLHVGTNFQNDHNNYLLQQHQQPSFGFGQAEQRGHAHPLYLSQTPASSSEFCLSTDVEDDEYNRLKHMSGPILRKDTSESTEEDSALFPALAQKTFSSAEDDFFQTGAGNTLRAGLSSPGLVNDHERAWSLSEMAAVSQGRPVSVLGSSHKGGNQQLKSPTATKPNKAVAAGLYPDSSDSEFDGGDDGGGQHGRRNQKESPFSETPLAGELCLSSPTSDNGLGSNNVQQQRITSPQGNAFREQWGNAVSPSSRSGALAGSRSSTRIGSLSNSATLFEDFVQGEWPASPTPGASARGSGRAANSNSFVSFGEHIGSPSSKKKSRGSGSSIASAPVVDTLVGGSKYRSSPRGNGGSRSVAPTSNFATSGHIRKSSDPFSPRGTSRMLDQLERELKEKQAAMEYEGSNAASSRQSTTIDERSRRMPRRKKDRESNVSPLVAQKRAADGRDDASSSEEEENDFLFDSVADTLGPRGVAADMESLSGRSTRSKTSLGGKSHKSTRSHRSHKSHRSRRSKNRHSSGASVSSRTSHYSHRSHMSEASRSVANDLLRLEMQLAMVGAEPSDDGAGRVSSASGTHRNGYGGGSVTGSVGGASRASRTSRTSRTARKKLANTAKPVTPRNKNTVVAPPGKLGLILANKADGKGTVVSGVRPASALVDKILPGDRIVAVDGEDVSLMNVSELTTIMTRKGDFERTLTIVSPLKVGSPAPMPLRGAETQSTSSGVTSPVANFSYQSR